jgi:hypothetical protein
LNSGGGGGGAGTAGPGFRHWKSQTGAGFPVPGSVWQVPVSMYWQPPVPPQSVAYLQVYVHTVRVTAQGRTAGVGPL